AFTVVLVSLLAERRQRETALQLALEGAQLGVFSADLATGQLQFDARATTIHGHTVEPTTIGESRRFVHRDDLVRIDAAFAKARQSGGTWNAEYRVLPPPNHPRAGETRWIAVEGSVVRDAVGTPSKLLGITRDITARKWAEQDMAERNTQ